MKKSCGLTITALLLMIKPTVNGVMKVTYESSARRGDSKNYYYCYMDENLNLITDKRWGSESSDFNERGYAAAVERSFEYKYNGIYHSDSEAWYLVGKDGSISKLPELKGTVCVYADPYFAIS